MSRSKRVTIFVLTFILILLASTAWAEGGVRPPADAAVTSNGELLSRAKTCDVLPLQLDGPLAVSDENGTVLEMIRYSIEQALNSINPFSRNMDIPMIQM